MVADWAAQVGEELRKTYGRYQKNGFFKAYFSGPDILDIGYKGYLADARPIFPHAIGVDLDYPGYDGRTLPFADQSQDTVFASHTLEHIPDYRQALRDWFRVLRIGGYLVVAVPHQYLYERNIALPSRFNGDHRRFYTAGSLLAEVEDTLDPMSYRLRLLEDNDEDFDYKIPPQDHAGGCYEIVMVLQRIVRPDYADTVLRPKLEAQPAAGRFLRVGGPASYEPLTTIQSDPPPKRVLILKLDHRGDFIMAYPAFEALRRLLPSAHLTLACGPWVEAEARQSGMFDALITADFFPEIASHAYNDRYVPNGLARFTKAIAGLSWDLAIDLRVDPDTRHLLAEVDARQRAGFGTAREFPFLDVFLPYINPTFDSRTFQALFTPSSFNTHVGRHEGYAIIHDGRRDRRKTGEVLIFGPWETFEAGSWRMEVAIEPLRGGFGLGYDVCSEAGHKIHQVGGLEIRPDSLPSFSLELEQKVERMEIRLRMGQAGRLPPFRFFGVRTYKKGVFPALHQQEMQMLLANLVGLRMQNPFSMSEEVP